MKFFPYEHMIFQSNFSDDEIVDLLHRDLEPKQKNRRNHILINPEDHKLFEGYLRNYHFKINRVEHDTLLYARNITGRITQNAFNSTIEIKIKLSSGNAALLFVVTFGFALFSVIGVVSLFDKMKLSYLFPLGLMIVLWTLFMLIFKRSVGKDIRHLSRIFEADPDIIK